MIFQVNPGMNTLESLHSKPAYHAGDGGHGGKNDRHGRCGENVVLYVPPGTVVNDQDTGEIIEDMEDTDGTATVAKGGRGGHGNARFATPTRQAPRYAKPGTPLHREKPSRPSRPSRNDITPLKRQWLTRDTFAPMNRRAATALASRRSPPGLPRPLGRNGPG